MTRHSELSRLLARIDEAYPKASVLYARLLIQLIGAADRTMPLADLSEAIGKGRDSSAVQSAVARLADLGMVTREMMPAGESGGRAYLVQMVRPA